MRTVEDLLAIARKNQRRKDLIANFRLTLLWTLWFTFIGLCLVLRLKAMGII